MLVTGRTWLKHTTTCSALREFLVLNNLFSLIVTGPISKSLVQFSTILLIRDLSTFDGSKLNRAWIYSLFVFFILPRSCSVANPISVVGCLLERMELDGKRRHQTSKNIMTSKKCWERKLYAGSLVLLSDGPQTFEGPKLAGNRAHTHFTESWRKRGGQRATATHSFPHLSMLSGSL